ncbi:hypothetical protein LUZ61_018873 [Rhynchospora tenuis]|uniref:Uncharacterized protein n=1 Tax=Rhynchospora tenuis TaxID=198213 RepID=A0AAD5ZA29_9POAL|nr:hypothetical protein LUZ61_018873 [Rhynchospora tenuis]
MASEIPLTKQIQLRLQELDGMDERRLAVQQNLELYQTRMTRAYEKLSRPRAFRKGEFVLVLRRPITGRHHGPKFAPNWEGPFIIDQVYDGGAYLLATENGEHPLPVLNGSEKMLEEAQTFVVAESIEDASYGIDLRA